VAKKRGVITHMIRAVTRAMAYACMILRKRCRERKIDGDVCTYYKMGPISLSFEIGIQDSEVEVKNKCEDSLPEMEIGEVEKIKSLVQAAVDKIVDLLIGGIAIGCKEMQKRHTQGNVWFGQTMALGIFPAEILIGLYVASDSIISGEVDDIDIEEVLAKEADEEAGKVVPTVEDGKRGALKVTVVQGRNLECADPLDTSTYTRVSVKDDYLYTKSIDQGKNPGWNQTLVFPAPADKELPPFVDLKVFDDNIVYSNCVLGKARIDLSDLKPKTPLEVWLPLEQEKVIVEEAGEQVAPAENAAEASPKGKKDEKKAVPMIRVVVVYDPDMPTPKITYPSIFGRVASGAAGSTGKSAKRAFKGSIRTGFKIAILATIIGRDKIKARNYVGKSMATVQALFWVMTISLSSKDSKVLPPQGKKEHSTVVKVVHAVYGKVLDVMSVGAETVQDMKTQGTLKLKMTIGLPLPVASYFSLSGGLALETESVTDRCRVAAKPIAGPNAAFDVAKQ
jgi:hypothetical protein